MMTCLEKQDVRSVGHQELQVEIECRRGPIRKESRFKSLFGSKIADCPICLPQQHVYA